MYLGVGPDQIEYAIHAGVLRRHFAEISSSTGKSCKFVLGIKCDVEDIFGHVLQYMYNGDYSIPAPTHNSASVTCEAELNAVYLQLRDEYLHNLMSTENFLGKLAGVFSQDLGSTFSEGTNPLCECPDVLLTHARLHIFAKSQDLDMLSRLSLWKLVHALLEQLVAHPGQNEGVVKLLRFVSKEQTADEDLITLMVDYVSSRLKFLVPCSSFAGLMQKQPGLTYRVLSNICDSL